MRHVRDIVGGLSLVVLVASSVVRADEEPVALDKLPKAIVAAMKKRFPGLEMTEAAKETADGKTVYEVSVKEKGKNIDVTLTPEGAITMIEKEIAISDLPRVVSEGIEKKYGKVTYKLAEAVYKVESGKETLSYYEALVVTADKKTMEAEIGLDGKIIKDEEKKDEKKEEKKDK